MYRPGATNRADALTRREQNLGNQIAAKIALRTQTILGPECLDPQMHVELAKDQDIEVCQIDVTGLDFIDEFLQVNRTAPSLQEYCEKARDNNSMWALENGLFKHRE
jgi:hypothetical protein